LKSLLLPLVLLAVAGCAQDEAASIPNAKPLDPAVAKKYAGWRFIPKAPGSSVKSAHIERGGAAK